MRYGSKTCPFCHSRFVFEDYELVDSMPADQPCIGCERLYVILAKSAQRKAEMKHAEEKPESVDLTPASILARLLASRGGAQPEPFDHAKRAASDAD